MDENLDWIYHTSQLHNKIQANKHLLSIARNVLDKDCLTKIYYLHIYSHLKYSLIVWGSMISSKQQNELFLLYKSCIRIMNRARKNAPTDVLFKENKILKFRDMIKLELLKFGYNLGKKDLPKPITNIMAGCQVIGWLKNIGL